MNERDKEKRATYRSRSPQPRHGELGTALGLLGPQVGLAGPVQLPRARGILVHEEFLKFLLTTKCRRLSGSKGADGGGEGDGDVAAGP